MISVLSQRSREPRRSEPRPPNPPRTLASPPRAGRFCPTPRPLLRSLLAREKQKAGARVCPPLPASSRPHSSSHLPAPQEEQDASSPRGATTGSDSSIASREAAAGYREAGKGAGSGGQGANSDITGGGGPEERAAWPRFPVNPRGILISGSGVAMGRA